MPNVARIDKDQMTLVFAIVNINLIRVYEIRKPDPKQVAIYIEHIRDSKRVKPILVDVDMHLLDGQCRYAAYKALGFHGVAINIAHFEEVIVRHAKILNKIQRKVTEKRNSGRRQ